MTGELTRRQLPLEEEPVVLALFHLIICFSLAAEFHFAIEYTRNILNDNTAMLSLELLFVERVIS